MRACVVCIPARDEAASLPRLIRSLDAQAGYAPAERLRVVVVANNCTDDTVARARAVRAGNLALRVIELTLPAAEAHVGTARRRALDAGADWLAADGREDGVLLTTDADARLPADWVAANLAALDGAEVVGGRLVIEEDDPIVAALHARIERYWAAVRAIEDLHDPPAHDPAPRHGDHTGASLALPAALYRAVGGLPVLPCGEDNALVGLLRRAGARLRHCPAVRVHVSGRRIGRVTGGMATEMTRRDAAASGAIPYALPEAGHWHRLILARAALRRAFAHDPRGALARAGLAPDQIAGVDPEGCTNDIAFVERAAAILEAAAPAPALVPVDAAVAALEAMARAARAAA